jgi:hypothetical protein
VALERADRADLAALVGAYYRVVRAAGGLDII